MTGIILSGGKSSRAGTNKALLKFGTETMIEKMYTLFSEIFGDVIISTNHPEEYPFLPGKKIRDEVTNCGPLGGIHAALKEANSESAFIISCDLPFITGEAIEYIVKHIGLPPITIPVVGEKIHPLCGVYSKDVVPILDDILNLKKSFSEDEMSQKQKVFGVYSLLKKVEVTEVIMDIAPFFDDNIFFNLNTREDYEKALLIMKMRS